MIGHLDKSTFDADRNYNEFYSGHAFEPFPEELALCADEVVPRVAWALDVAQEIDAKTVLDLCCLDGFASLTLANKLGVEVHGYDLSKPGIDLANERAKKYGLHADYIQEAIEDLEFPKPYDLVLLFEAIEHFTDPDKVMAVIKRFLKPGGTLLVTTPDAEGAFGFSNNDTCHLRIYSQSPASDLPEDWSDITKNKPVVSLPDYLRSQGFTVEETAVYSDLIHCRVKLEA